MKLRNWQSGCIETVSENFKRGKRHNLVLATPGSGKTLMTSVLANHMFEEGIIDLVICFAPSSIVADDFRVSLETQTGSAFNGMLGAKGQSLTYQSMQYLDSDFWSLLEKYRVLAIFDEIHHCSGDNESNANSWGKQLIKNVKEQAAFTLSLTGTPWRSDDNPIALSSYDETGAIEYDFAYGLSEAINDGVCRLPNIVVLDNDNIRVHKKGESKEYSSLKPILGAKILPYTTLIHNDEIISELLSLTKYKLDKIRQVNTRAGGLIVASSVEHANQIADILRVRFGDSSTVVTYLEDKPSEIIRNYRVGNSKWIISVGMISEGTNIPRLQVCCHLSNIKTELYYRQILGRIVRITEDANQEAVLYMLNEPTLVKYAERVADDIPEDINVISYQKPQTKGIKSTFEPAARCVEPKSSIETLLEVGSIFDVKEVGGNCLLDRGYENSVNIYGQFRQELVETGFKLSA